jgi:hypothetical protein
MSWGLDQLTELQLQVLDRIASGREPPICMGCPATLPSGVPPPGNETALALPSRCASCATLDAWHNWHGRRYANAPDMVLQRVCCEILQVCPLLLRLLLRGW